MKCIFNEYSDVHYRFLMMNSVMKVKCVLIQKKNSTKTPLAKLLIYFFMQTQMSNSAEFPLDLINVFKPQDIDNTIYSIMVTAQRRLGDVLRSESQTFPQCPKFSRCRFCICQSTLADRSKGERLVQIHITYYVNMDGSDLFFFSLVYNVNEHVQCFYQIYVYGNVEFYVVDCSIARFRSLTVEKN